MQFQLTCLPVNLKRSDKTDGARLRLDLEESLFQKGPGPRSKLKGVEIQWPYGKWVYSWDKRGRLRSWWWTGVSLYQVGSIFCITLLCLPPPTQAPPRSFPVIFISKDVFLPNFYHFIVPMKWVFQTCEIKLRIATVHTQIRVLQVIFSMLQASSEFQGQVKENMIVPTESIELCDNEN